jgi:glycosyltransferase involved in cell wall biosynthesis
MAMLRDLETFFSEIQILDIVFLCIVGVIWSLLLFLNILFYLRLAFYKVPGLGAATIPVTVIMIERNEEENLKKNLPGWLSMGYPEYEVLVVDDYSEDNSFTTVGIMRLENPRLKMTGLNQETRYSEKLSRNLALKAATFEKIVFAAPDILPPDNHWLPGIATAFHAQKELALGYTRYTPGKGFYHNLFRVESFIQQTDSMAFCLNGLPYVFSEENIAFSKKAYFDINGFAGKIGEENLNMEMIFNQVIRKNNNAVLAEGDLSLEKTLVAGKHEFRELYHKSFILKQYLGFGIRFVSGFFNLSRILYAPLLAACVILYPAVWPLVTALFIILAIIRLTSLKRMQNRLNEPGIFVSSVIYGMLVPYVRIFTNWRYRYQRKNP